MESLGEKLWIVNTFEDYSQNALHQTGADIVPPEMQAGPSPTPTAMKSVLFLFFDS